MSAKQNASCIFGSWFRVIRLKEQNKKNLFKKKKKLVTCLVKSVILRSYFLFSFFFFKLCVIYRFVSFLWFHVILWAAHQVDYYGEFSIFCLFCDAYFYVCNEITGFLLPYFDAKVSHSRHDLVLTYLRPPVLPSFYNSFSSPIRSECLRVTCPNLVAICMLMPYSFSLIIF